MRDETERERRRHGKEEKKRRDAHEGGEKGRGERKKDRHKSREKHDSRERSPERVRNTPRRRRDDPSTRPFDNADNSNDVISIGTLAAWKGNWTRDSTGREIAFA